MGFPPSGLPEPYDLAIQHALDFSRKHKGDQFFQMTQGAVEESSLICDSQQLPVILVPLSRKLSVAESETRETALHDVELRMLGESVPQVKVTGEPIFSKAIKV
jgi:hypothetical protein